MLLAPVDWIIIGLYLLLSAGIAAMYSKRASGSTTDFFLSGRNLPWWIAGTTMVATTFAADTPLAVTELVASNGIAGNWLWWNMLIGGMLTVFFYARLWRRAGILTDIEFVEIRYDGKPAAFLRGFRAVYLGFFMNLVILGWVNLAMVKIFRVLFPELTFLGLTQLNFIGFELSSHLLWVGALMLLVAIYSSIAGMWGVAITDVIQFTIAMIGSILLAVTALRIPEVGGIAGLKAKLPESVFQMVPAIGSQGGGIGSTLSLTFATFFAYIGVQWWATWYPGAEPGGGGYIAQRMMSAKDEKHSLFATLWFAIAHYAVRPWPWIIVALVSLVLYPDLPSEAKGEGFVMVMRDHLPAGLLGLLVAAFLAAYMSTISTQLNWGSSYLVNDFYRRFMNRQGGEKDYVRAARIFTVGLMVVSLLVTSKMDRISDAWVFIVEASAGIGLVLILRWFWWRINAWSEITAMAAPLMAYPLVKHYLVFPHSLFALVLFSAIVWISATFLTRPTNQETLKAFFERVHPGGWGWAPIAAQMPHVQGDRGYKALFIDWAAGVVLVISAMFGTGKLIFGETLAGLGYLTVTCAMGAVIYMHLSKIGWDKVGSE